MAKITLIADHPAEGFVSMDRYAKELFAAHQAQNRPVRSITPPDPLSGTYGRLLTRTFRYPQWANRLSGEYFHLLDHSYGRLLSGLPKERTVVTLHDIAPLLFKRRIPGISYWTWQLAWREVRRARYILCGSYFIREQITPFLSPESQVNVAYYGVNPMFRLDIDQRAQIRAQYEMDGRFNLLHVGRIHARKNLETAILALFRLKEMGLPAKLWQLGGDPAPLQNLLDTYREYRPDIHFMGKVSDETLVGFYNAADLFIFPSLYEGFGLPVIEAMACGLPVIGSDRSSVPEVIGNAGLSLPADNPLAFAEAAAELWESPSMLNEYKARGLARAQQFSWAETARQTWLAYESFFNF